MKKTINLKLLEFEVAFLEQTYGKMNVEWPKDFSWIKVLGFRLPQRLYNHDSTDCLIPIPHMYGFGAKLENFYVNKSLKLRDGTDIPHTFFNNHRQFDFQHYYKKDWRWLCIYADKDAADGILTFMKQIELFLKHPLDHTLI